MKAADTAQPAKPEIFPPAAQVLRMLVASLAVDGSITSNRRPAQSSAFPSLPAPSAADSVAINVQQNPSPTQRLHCPAGN